MCEMDKHETVVSGKFMVSLLVACSGTNRHAHKRSTVTLASQAHQRSVTFCIRFCFSIHWAIRTRNFYSLMYLNHEIYFTTPRQVREVATRFEMCPLSIGVTLVHLFFASLWQSWLIKHLVNRTNHKVVHCWVQKSQGVNVQHCFLDRVLYHLTWATRAIQLPVLSSSHTACYSTLFNLWCPH